LIPSAQLIPSAEHSVLVRKATVLIVEVEALRDAPDARELTGFLDWPFAAA
jgi:hypothetical protein